MVLGTKWTIQFGVSSIVSFVTAFLSVQHFLKLFLTKHIGQLYLIELSLSLKFLEIYHMSLTQFVFIFPSAYSFTNKPSNNPLFFIFFLRHFCLTKAYNLCHQVALVDRPMRREVAIRWTNRKRAASSLGKCHSDWNAQNSPMLPTTIAMSDDVSWTWE